MAPFRAVRVNGFRAEKLMRMTDGLPEANCLGRFQFGKIYRGTGESSNLVFKVFEDVDNYLVYPGDNEGRVQDELYLAHDEYLMYHPNMIKIEGVSMPNERLIVIYEVEALNTVRNLIENDGFSWLQRVKVAYGFASIVAHMHDCKPIPYIVRNISAAHILLDQEYNPKLYDFSMISGGNLVDKRELVNQYINGCHGYIDPDYTRNGKWSEKCDVFAYGVVLASLISKKVVMGEAVESFPEPSLFEWSFAEVEKKVNEQKFSLVHQCLAAEALFSTNDGASLTKLAIQCMHIDPMKRPTMNQVVERLRKLSIFQSRAGFFGFQTWNSTSNSKSSGFAKLVRMKPKQSSQMKKNILKDLGKKLSGNGNNKLTIKELEFHTPKILSYQDLKRFTNDFNEKNYIGVHQFGKLYHGKENTRMFTVKTWEDVGISSAWEGDNEKRLRDELMVLQHPKFISHPNVVKMIGYCYEGGKLGIVYDLEALDSLANLIEKDIFTWRHRVQFAIKLADLLKCLHDRHQSCSPYVVRNLFPINILVDKDFNPKLFSFDMLLGGFLNDRERLFRPRIRGWQHCIDPYTHCYDRYTIWSDIYSYGLVLLNMITKKIEIEGELYYFHYYPYDEYERAASLGSWGLQHFSLADQSFITDPEFDFKQGQKLSILVMNCLHRDYLQRPTTVPIIKYLKKILKQCK